MPGGVAGSEAGGPDPEDLGAAGIVYADVIKEIDASGTVTWTWQAAEHLDPALYPLQPHYRREHWPLINGVYPLADGTVVASLRSVSAVIRRPSSSPTRLTRSSARTGTRRTRCRGCAVSREARKCVVAATGTLCHGSAAASPVMARTVDSSSRR